MYSKTRLGSDQIDGSLRLSRRGRRIVYVIVAAVVAVGAGIAIWSGVSGDQYTVSANGCVNVTVPSTMGGGRLHYCGAQAQSFCKHSFENSDEVSLLARPQCVSAGLTKAKVGG
jgi:hypothetical protein